MDNFIKEIIDLDKSINNLDIDFNNKKNEGLVEFNKKKEKLFDDYEKDYNFNLEECRKEIEDSIKKEQLALKEKNNNRINNITEAFKKNKNLIIEKVFEKHFSEESD